MLANYQMYRIASLEVDDEIQVDIDWKLLSDPMWNMVVITSSINGYF